MTVKLDGGLITPKGEMRFLASDPDEAANLELVKEYLGCSECGACVAMGLIPLLDGPVRDLRKGAVANYRCDGVPLDGTKTTDGKMIKTTCARRVSDKA